MKIPCMEFMRCCVILHDFGPSQSIGDGLVMKFIAEYASQMSKSIEIKMSKSIGILFRMNIQQFEQATAANSSITRSSVY